MYDIARAAPADQPALLAGARNGLSAKELAAASRRSRNGGKPAGNAPPPATKRIKCVVPGKEQGKAVTVVVSGEAITFADMICVRKDLHRQAVAASDQGVIDARVFQGLCKDRMKAKPAMRKEVGNGQ
jgi:hypothetical protein